MSNIKKISLKIVCVFWLVVITPIFGIFPLWTALPIPMPRTMLFIGMAFLREIICLFVIDPEPNTSDVGPPLTKLGFITMILFVLGISALAIKLLMLPTAKINNVDDSNKK